MLFLLIMFYHIGVSNKSHRREKTINENTENIQPRFGCFPFSDTNRHKHRSIFLIRLSNKDRTILVCRQMKSTHYRVMIVEEKGIKREGGK